MTLYQLVRASLRFHARSHLGVILGAAVGSAALIGALVVGDSVRETLKDRAAERLGATELALSSGDRLFRRELSVVFGWRPAGSSGSGRRQFIWGSGDWPLQPVVAGALRLRGTMARQDGTARALEVQIHGVTSNFWSFSPRAAAAQRAMVRSGHGTAASLEYIREMESWARPAPGRVRLNRALATQLRAGPGDTVILRFPKPTALSQDAVLSPRNESSAAMRLVVEDVVDGAGFGDFALSAGARPALNAFVGLDELGRSAGVTNRINLMVAQGGSLEVPPEDWRWRFRRWTEQGGWGQVLGRLATGLSVKPAPAWRVEEHASRLLTQAWRLEDGQVGIRVLAESSGRPAMVEVASPRIFLDPPVVAASTAPDPRLPEADREERGWLTNGVRVLTYLANGMRHGDRLVPYSMVTAAGAPWTPADLGDDEIVVTDWVAKDLGVGVGDPVELTYFDPEAGARLVERTNVFRVRSVVPLTGWHADRSLMPEFPGLSKAESTQDWDAGFPLAHRIRDQDEAYWKEHRGTPKAYVSLAAGQRMWANRFGSATAVRFMVPAGVEPESVRHRLEANVRATLRPADVGLVFEPVREQAMRAATSGQDFGGLFIGFSLFLVLAAMLLMALLFQFGLEQRLPEVGTLLALGFRPALVRRLWLGEGVALAMVGASIGVVGGLGYARAMILGLTTLWREAVGGTWLEFHATLGSVVGGWVGSVVVCGIALYLTLRRQFLRPARELLAGEIAVPRGRPGRRAGWIGALALAAGVALTGWALVTGETANAGAFFGAGSLILIGGLACLSSRLARLARPGRPGPAGNGAPAGTATSTAALGLGSLAVRGTARRSSRSVATAALLAIGTFLVASLGVFRMDARRGAWERGAGTGGFALIGESSLPVSQDLNTSAGLEFFGLGTNDLPGVAFVGFRVRDGDDASCLNLNRAQRPRILGVRPEALSGRGAFTFAQRAKGVAATHEWEALRAGEAAASGGAAGAVGAGAGENPKDVPEYPAIGDAASIQWALGSRVGGVLEMTDERGLPFRLRLVAGVANSVLQGNLVIDEAVFTRLFPGESGQRWFLIDTPTNQVTEVSEKLSRAMQDVGLELTPAPVRLAQFNAVQNTYLSTFQVLGGLGLLLGSAGLGVVVLRNVLERRGELALLTAVGFRRPVLERLVLSEHAALLGVGLGIGLASAAVAVLPSLLGSGSDLPVRSLELTLGGVVMLGLLTAWMATRASLRGRLLDALRGD